MGRSWVCPYLLLVMLDVGTPQGCNGYISSKGKIIFCNHHTVERLRIHVNFIRAWHIQCFQFVMQPFHCTLKRSTPLQTSNHHSFGHIHFIGKRFALENIDLGLKLRIFVCKIHQRAGFWIIGCYHLFQARKAPILVIHCVLIFSHTLIKCSTHICQLIFEWPNCCLKFLSHDGRKCIQRRNTTFRIRFWGSDQFILLCFSIHFMQRGHNPPFLYLSIKRHASYRIKQPNLILGSLEPLEPDCCWAKWLRAKMVLTCFNQNGYGQICKLQRKLLSANLCKMCFQRKLSHMFTSRMKPKQRTISVFTKIAQHIIPSLLWTPSGSRRHWRKSPVWMKNPSMCKSDKIIKIVFTLFILRKILPHSLPSAATQPTIARSIWRCTTLISWNCDATI